MPQSELLPKFARPTRDPGGEHPLAAIAQEQLKAGSITINTANYWYICKLNGFDLFVGKVIEPLKPPSIIHDFAARFGYTRGRTASVETAHGKIVRAEISGILNKDALTEDQRREILLFFVDPHREVRPNVHPEIFTFSSAFNHVKRDWHMINSSEHINTLSPGERENLLADLLTAGIGVLERETAYVHIQKAAKRLRQLNLATFIKFHATSGESHFPAYYPKIDVNTPGMGDVRVPVAWMQAALKTPISALSSLLYVCSLVRDDSYSRLHGPSKIASQMRAEGLVAEFIKEVDRYDGRIYFLDSHYDEFIRAILKKYPRGATHVANLYYDDPTDRQKERINQNV